MRYIIGEVEGSKNYFISILEEAKITSVNCISGVDLRDSIISAYPLIQMKIFVDQVI